MKRVGLLMCVIVATLTATALGANSDRNFGGVGIDGVPLSDGRIAVRQLVAGGPAHRAGMRTGDIITHVDSKPTKGSKFKDIVNFRLRGRAGTKVLLTVNRQGEPRPLNFTLVRRQLLVAK